MSRSRRLRKTLLLAALCFLGGGGTAWLYLSGEDPRLKKIEELERVIARLEEERRIAEVVVLSRKTDPSTGRIRTRFRFADVLPDGSPGSPREYEIDGDLAYFEALVVKFERGLVREGDALRGRSLYLFRRVFGERQAPENGFPLDAQVPGAYRTADAPSEFERDLWARFWEYALNPKLASQQGIRVAQGEAVLTRLVPDRLYRLTIENAGGINIVAEPLPVALRSPAR